MESAATLDSRSVTALCQALVPRHREQPTTQPLRLAQPGEPAGGDDEDVLQAVLGIGGGAQLEQVLLVARAAEWNVVAIGRGKLAIRRRGHVQLAEGQLRGPIAGRDNGL